MPGPRHAPAPRSSSGCPGLPHAPRPARRPLLHAGTPVPAPSAALPARGVHRAGGAAPRGVPGHPSLPRALSLCVQSKCGRSTHLARAQRRGAPRRALAPGGGTSDPERDASTEAAWTAAPSREQRRVRRGAARSHPRPGASELSGGAGRGGRGSRRRHRPGHAPGTPLSPRPAARSALRASSLPGVHRAPRDLGVRVGGGCGWSMRGWFPKVLVPAMSFRWLSEALERAKDASEIKD